MLGEGNAWAVVRTARQQEQPAMSETVSQTEPKRATIQKDEVMTYEERKARAERIRLRNQAERQRRADKNVTCVHICAALYRRDDARLLAASIVALGGYEIVSSWLDTTDRDEDLTDAQKTKVALRNMDDAMGCNVVVLLGDDPMVPSTAADRGGRHVEFGMALSRGAAVKAYAVGHRENIFASLATFVATQAELLVALGRGDK